MYVYFNKFFRIESSPRHFIFVQVKRRFPMLGALFFVGQYLVNRRVVLSEIRYPNLKMVVF